MSHPSSRDDAVTTMRVASIGVALAGLTLTGGVAGLFARELSPDDAGAGQRDRRVVVVVDPQSRPAGQQASAPSSRSAAAPAVQAPAEPTAPAATSSGSDAS